MTKLIRGLGHLSFRVPNIHASLNHATQILGLREVIQADHVAYLTNGEAHHTLELIPSDRAALDHIGLEVTSITALEELSTILEREGVAHFTPSSQEPGVAHSIRFKAPGGFLFEAYIPARSQPPSSEDVHAPTQHIGSLPAALLQNGPGIRPRKLGHVMLKCEDVPQMERFLGEVLGFHLSERVGSDIVFMRCGIDHHTLNIVHGPNGLHHYAWEVESWADLERLGDHLHANNMTLIWGPGRHGPGNNLFAYHLDPAGVVVEYFADPLCIEDEATYQPLDWSNDARAANLWGPGPSPDFFEHGIGL